MNYDIRFVLLGLTKNNLGGQFTYEDAWWPFDFLPRKKEKIKFGCIDGTVFDIVYNIGNPFSRPEIIIYINKILDIETMEELEELEVENKKSIEEHLEFGKTLMSSSLLK